MFSILYDLVNLTCVFAIILYILIFSEIYKDLTNHTKKVGKIHD